MIDTDTLRAVAKATYATRSWEFQDTVVLVVNFVSGTEMGIRFLPEDAPVAVHIATFDPPTVLALLDTIDSLRAEVARLQGADDGK
jgi:hypothetical protein